MTTQIVRPVRLRIAAAALGWLFAPIACIHAEAIPAPGAVDSRVRVAQYNADEVYKLRGFVGYAVDLEFEPGEMFVGLGAGDLEGLSFFGQENHLFLKPKAALVATNLTVLTTRRHYHIDYEVLSRRPYPGDPGVIFSVRFVYPVPSSPPVEVEARRVEASLDQAFGTRAKNKDYWYCGDRSIQPVSASDDGVHTMLRFSETSELPALFVRNGDGSESLLNFSMESGAVVIHRVARQFVVRRGALTGCIVNRGYRGSGERLKSGTVSTDVQRRVLGSVP